MLVASANVVGQTSRRGRGGKPPRSPPAGGLKRSLSPGR
jgi:hypothetical protein